VSRLLSLSSGRQFSLLVSFWVGHRAGRRSLLFISIYVDIKADAERTTGGDMNKKIIVAALLAAWALGLGIILTQPARAQGQAAEQASRAAAKMSFDAISVKLNKAGLPPAGPMQKMNATAEVFSMTNCGVYCLIGFAYNLTLDQGADVYPQIPKDIFSERFDVEARAANEVTQDQMRLMVRSLLEDRFKLAMHYEMRQKSFYNLVIAKAGKLGPQLRPYGNEEPCPTGPPSSPTVAGGFPAGCGSPQFMNSNQPGLVRSGSRNVSLEQITAWMRVLGGLDRPVFDRTGLSGTFDFVLEWDKSASTNPQSESTGPTFVEALQDQLGLKLESDAGLVKTFVVDHIEQPTPN
jgi:uncharacterized protein (TIGR03435 family)